MSIARHPKSQQKLHIQKALSECADFLSCYFPLANAHPVDFIVQDLWNLVLPESIQKELSSLNHSELQQLPWHKNLLLEHNHWQVSQTKTEKSEGNSLDTLSDLEFKGHYSTPCNRSGSSSRSQKMPWKNCSLQDFLTEVQQHCVENLPCLQSSMQNLTVWLQQRDASVTQSTLFVHAFMKEKKLHEVEVMADLCSQVFHKSSVDVFQATETESTDTGVLIYTSQLASKVVDLGSGKGYLSTHLFLQCGLPVLGIDSQSNNTFGASKRAEKLGQQWDTLVKHGLKKASSKSKEKHLQVESAEKKDVCGLPNGSPAEFQPTFSTNVNCELSDETNAKLNLNPGTSLLCDIQNDGSKPNILCVKYDTDRSYSCMNENKCQENPDYQSRSTGKCIAQTLLVRPNTDLSKLVQESAATLCPEKSDRNLKLLLTGLHTCGPLASTMLRLFARDDAVQAMCGVGCCYQLMQEIFADEEGCEQVPQLGQDFNQPCAGGAVSMPCQEEGDFPLSSLLLERKMCIGRSALNMASLALPRMTHSSEELQGQTFYPRALLQAIIQKKLGYIPQNMKKLRGLSKRSCSPVDYILKALQKLDINDCQLTEEEVMAFHEEHCHQEEKMAAFFQLRAALAPVVETLVLLDRLLFLLEQDSVEEAFLVQLFDPVTSPRCHALIAIKRDIHTMSFTTGDLKD